MIKQSYRISLYTNRPSPESAWNYKQNKMLRLSSLSQFADQNLRINYLTNISVHFLLDFYEIYVAGCVLDHESRPIILMSPL